MKYDFEKKRRELLENRISIPKHYIWRQYHLKVWRRINGMTKYWLSWNRAISEFAEQTLVIMKNGGKQNELNIDVTISFHCQRLMYLTKSITFYQKRNFLSLSLTLSVLFSPIIVCLLNWLHSVTSIQFRWRAIIDLCIVKSGLSFHSIKMHSIHFLCVYVDEMLLEFRSKELISLCQKWADANDWIL